MKTLAINIGDDEWRAAEEHAARQAATLGDLVRDFVRDLAREENGAETRARRQLLEMSERSQATVGQVRWKRKDLFTLAGY